jgi:hypothetical protein
MTGLDQIYPFKEKQMRNKLMMVIGLLALALFAAACGTQAATNEPGQATAIPTVSIEDAAGTAGIPQTGLDDLDEVLNTLRTNGATVNIADPVESDVLSVPGQIVHINDEEVEFYTYGSVEQAEAESALVADLTTPEGAPQFYRLGNMLVRYVGNNTLVRDLMEDVLGAQAAGQ